MNRFSIGISASAILLLLFTYANPLSAQNIYVLHWQKESPIIGLGIAGSVAGLALGHRVEPLSTAQIDLLQRNDVWTIDRQATLWRSPQARKASDWCFYGATAIPLLFLADKNMRKEPFTVALLYAEALSLTTAATHITKNLALRTRPYAYNAALPTAEKLGKDTRRSFFSGHTSSTATSCFFAAKVWSDFHPQSPWKPVVWATAATIPAVTGYLRMRTGQHFFTDVAVGYLVGAAAGWLIPACHKTKNTEKTGWNIRVDGNGVGLVNHFK